MSRGLKTILVIDDSKTARLNIRYILENEGYSIVEAENGEIGLKIAGGKEVDLITLDVEMPGMNGYEVCAALRANESTSNIPVIMITSKKETEEIKRGFRAGISDYLVKPYKEKDLKDKVNNYFKFSESAKQGNIAIVEDSRTDIYIATYSAKMCKLNYSIFTSGEDFLKSSEEFDLILLDIYLPDINGLELVRKIQQTGKHSDTPILIISADESTETIVKSYLMGVDDYIVKPFDSKILSAKLSSLFRSAKYQEIIQENKYREGRIKLFNEMNIALAHNLNNILSSLTLNINYLETLCTAKKGKERFNYIYKDIDRIKNILEKLEKIKKSGEIPLEKYIDDLDMVKLE